MKVNGMHPLKKLLFNKSDVLDLISKSINYSEPLLLTYLNQHCFNVWYSDANYRNLLDRHFKYYLDGIGVRFALFLINKIKAKRFNASEINEEVFNRFTELRTPIIIIGGRFESLIPKSQLNVIQYFNGYEDVVDWNKLSKEIIQSDTKTIIIGIGAPTQEVLAYKIFSIVQNLQIICVGNFLEYFFRTKKRAPKIFHNSGFEWLYRLIHEPKRLWSRYIIGIPVFSYRLLKIKFTYKQRGK